MKNLAMAKKLEGEFVNIPTDYGNKIMAIGNSVGMYEFADAIVHNINGAIKTHGGRSLSTMHILGVFMATINMMIKSHIPKPEIISAFGLVPQCLTVIIANERARQEAITFFNGEMEELMK